ncbi:glycosyltransferase family 39 protein [Candidatus Sumerlaeota bacterium]|nr:glycosyltransferase family 39 protein [Candidatus Sumerlaeota bacterium]
MNPSQTTTFRVALVILAITCIALAISLPEAWYAALPRRSDLPPPGFSGLKVMKWTLGAWAAILTFLAARPPKFEHRTGDELLGASARPAESDLPRRAAMMWLAGVSALAFALRVDHINSDLWLDEINPIVTYGPLPLYQVFTTYLLAGNHQLHTFLVKLLVSIAGEREWIIRTPALLFGVACIPAIYWFARFAMSRVQSLCLALLLAVSYHMVEYSQNARGYSMHIFFSIMTSGLLVDALRRDRAASWIWFALLSMMSFATQMIGAFVTAGQLIVALLEIFLHWRHGGRVKALLLNRLPLVYTSILAFAVLMYSIVLPEFLNYQKYFYQQDETSGFRPFTLEFVTEMIRGIGEGFGPGFMLGAIPLLLAGAAGFYFFCRRNRAVALMLTMPCVLMMAYMLGRGIPVAPRYFLIAIPVVFMTAVHAAFGFAEWTGARLRWPDGRARRAAMALVGLMVLASAASLPRLYRHPKQDYTGAIRFLQTLRKHDEPIIVIHYAERGMEYYGEKLGLEKKDLVVVRSDEAFRRNEAMAREQGAYAVTTLMRALRIENPAITDSLRENWTQVKVFPGTIGNGSIIIWKLGIKDEGSEPNRD